uniref:RRM domain-containing protein n=1 Tax=Anisakis simplex TaxID=6269 RepID=A0A0M3JPQ8_ANISI
LPYNANAGDIEDFFKPLTCLDIRLGYNDDRRPSGDAYVIFPTMAEARDALSRNKKCIGTRLALDNNLLFQSSGFIHICFIQ